MHFRNQNLLTLLNILLLLAVLCTVSWKFTSHTWHPLPFFFAPEHTDRIGKTDLVTVAFTGDMLLGDGAEAFLQEKGYDAPFKYTAATIRSADLAIGNHEGTITDRGNPKPDKRWAYRAAPESVKAISDTGFDMLMLANNHYIDFGADGMLDTWQHLKDNGISPLGGAPASKADPDPVTVVTKGVSMTFYSYMYPFMYRSEDYFKFYAHEHKPGQGGSVLAWSNRFLKDIHITRKLGTLDIVILHIGDRYEHVTERKAYLDYISFLIDNGADAIICHGTHFAGEVGTVRGVPVFYGIGNFAFGTRNKRANYGLIAVLHINPQTKKIKKAQAIPICTNNKNRYVRFQSRILDDFLATRVLHGIQRISEHASDDYRIENGSLWLDL